MSICKHCGNPIENETIWNTNEDGNGYHHRCLIERELRRNAKKIYQKSKEDGLKKSRIIIRLNILMKKDEVNKLREDILKQMEDGVIILPTYCEVIENQSDAQIEIKEAENEDQNNTHRN